jgi:hypothetical protein
MQSSSAFVNHRVHQNSFRHNNNNSSNKHAPPVISFSSSSFISFHNSPHSTYETIEHCDRELLNSLNRHDMRIIGNYLDNKKARGVCLDDEMNASRPISLLSVDSNDTIVDQTQESTFEDDDTEEEDNHNDQTEEEVDESQARSDFGDRSRESWRQKLDNLKFYSNQGSEIKSNLNEQIESLHRTLEIFLENKSQAAVASSDRGVIYAEPFPVNFVTSSRTLNKKPASSIMSHLNSDFCGSSYQNTGNAYSENIKNRLFFNFNHRNNSMYFNTALDQDVVKDSSQTSASYSDTRTSGQQNYEHTNRLAQKKTLHRSTECSNSLNFSESTSMLNRFFKMIFFKKQKMI